MSQFSGFAIKQQTDVKTARGAVRSRAAAGFDDDDYGEEEEKTEFISSFDTETKKKDEVNLPVIPCIPNSFQTGEKIKLNNAEDEEPKEKKANRTAEEDATKAKSEKVVETSPVDEDEEALNAILQDAADFESMRLKEDLENCPDMEEGQYSNVTIETFGEAMLRGMGWEKGKAYGKYGNEVVEPMEYIPRHHRLGLGANPEAAEDKLKEKADRRKYIKPGETREPKKFYGLAPGEDGRVRHHRGLNEKLVEIKAARIEAGNPVLVTRGPHEDLYGLIDSLGETSCRVRLAISKEVVKIKTSHLKAIAAHEYKALGRPVRKVKTGTRPNNPSPSPPLPAESGNSSERRSRNSRREERGGEKGRGRGGRSEREKEKGRESRYDSRHREARKEKEGSAPSWLAPHIVVRVVSQELHRGLYYTKKGVVVDISSPTRCALRMIDSGKLLDGVPVADLETALPKVGGTALILRGPHRGTVGKLLERNKRTGQAAIQCFSTMNVCNADFDNVAEYTGYVESV